jgi:hypothetical protein
MADGGWRMTGAGRRVAGAGLESGAIIREMTA